jgi:ribosomal protein S18 acetylase RimI-like enzyme
MAVDEHAQQKGVGTCILAGLETAMRERGATSFVTESRESAVRFYQKHGYHVVRKSHLLFGKIQHFFMRKET